MISLERLDLVWSKLACRLTVSNRSLRRQTTPKNAWSELRHPFFFKFCPNHNIFVIGEARHFKFCVLIDTLEYKCMRDTLLDKWMCLESRDLFRF